MEKSLENPKLKAFDLYEQEWFLSLNNQSKLDHRASVDSGFGDEDDDFDFEQRTLTVLKKLVSYITLYFFLSEFIHQN